MSWAPINELSPQLPIPQGYRIEQLKRTEIPDLIRCFKIWFPDIAVGAERCYHQDEFYRNAVSLEGEPETDVIVLVIKKGAELVGMASLQRSEDTGTIYARMGAISPDHRGERLANVAVALVEQMGRAIGMDIAYALAQFSIPNMQGILERAGFRIVGIFPASDRMIVEPGITKRVYEAIYVKVLVSDEHIVLPRPESMTPKTKALYDFLFGAQ
jgi:N-acetylglutamate synthase-like GNAT family acetyltransferase